MTPPEALQQHINTLIREQLNKHHCTSGSLHYRPAYASLKGIKADDKPVLIWELPRQLNILLAQFMESREEGAGLTIEAHLANDHFVYRVQSAATLKMEADKAKQEQEEANQRHKLELKNTLSHQTASFGNTLANKVADVLEHRSNFIDSHYGYCGMGLEFREGAYCYGEVWDGALYGTLTRFNNREAFVNWLAQQSDASMARLEADSFYWGNQTITRSRLEAFVDNWIE